jgi:hypothetical protein
MQLVGIRVAGHQGGRVGAPWLAEARRSRSARRRDQAVPARALGGDDVGCSAGHTSAGGFAVDDAVELPSGYVPGEVDHHEQWGWPRPYRTYAELLGRGGGLPTVAEAHRRLWTGVVEAVPDGPPPWSSPTAVGSSRGWWPACRMPTTSRGVHRSDTVTAPVSASTRAGSSGSSSPGCRRSCCPGAPRLAGGECRSFLSVDRRNDRPPRRPRAPKEFVQLPGLASPRHRGETAP